MRKEAPGRVESVIASIGEQLGAFTPQECANYFKNAGYGLTENHPALAGVIRCGLVIIRRAVDAENFKNRALISRLWGYARRPGAAIKLMLRPMLALALGLEAYLSGEASNLFATDQHSLQDLVIRQT